MAKPAATLPEISDHDLVVAYKERERLSRKALERVQKLREKVEELKVEAKAARDLLDQAQLDLERLTGLPVQTIAFPPAGPTQDGE